MALLWCNSVACGPGVPSQHCAGRHSDCDSRRENGLEAADMALNYKFIIFVLCSDV
jgi:hypothetical protein